MGAPACWECREVKDKTEPAAGYPPIGMMDTALRFWQEEARRLRAALECLVYKSDEGGYYIAVREDYDLSDIVAPLLNSHASDCAVNNAPALPVGPCDCAAGTPIRVDYMRGPDGWLVTLHGRIQHQHFSETDEGAARWVARMLTQGDW